MFRPSRLILLGQTVAISSISLLCGCFSAVQEPAPFNQALPAALTSSASPAALPALLADSNAGRAVPHPALSAENPEPVRPTPRPEELVPSYFTRYQQQAAPSWSPDGRYLIFISQLPYRLHAGGLYSGNYSYGAEAAYYMMDLQTGRASLLGKTNRLPPSGSQEFDSLEISASWSESGDWALLTAGSASAFFGTHLLHHPSNRQTPLSLAKINWIPQWSSQTAQTALIYTSYNSSSQSFRAELRDPNGEIQARWGPLKAPGQFSPQALHWLTHSRSLLVLKSQPYQHYYKQASQLALTLYGPGSEAQQTLWSLSKNAETYADYLSVSPNEQYAAFVLKRSSYTYPGSPQNTLIIMNLSTGKMAAEYQANMLHGAMNCSRDSRQLAFSAKDPNSEHTEIFSLELSEVSPARVRQLTQTSLQLAISNREPAWSPDAQAIIFSSDRERKTSFSEEVPRDLYRLDLRTRAIERLTCSHGEIVIGAHNFYGRMPLPDWQCP